MQELHEYFTPALQVAWNEFHKTPSDFKRVERYFIEALADGGLQSRHHYAKFVEQFDRVKARNMFHELSKEHETSKLFYARNLAFYGGYRAKLKGIALLDELVKKGNLVAKLFLSVSIFKVLPLHKKILFAPCQFIRLTSAMYCLVKNRDHARREMWGVS
jgi:hypothetical protein